MHRRGRLQQVAAHLFACRVPVAAREIGWRVGVREGGVARCLRLLERRGVAERLVGERADGAVMQVWRWKDG